MGSLWRINIGWQWLYNMKFLHVSKTPIELDQWVFNMCTKFETPSEIVRQMEELKRGLKYFQCFGTLMFLSHVYLIPCTFFRYLNFKFEIQAICFFCSLWFCLIKSQFTYSFAFSCFLLCLLVFSCHLFLDDSLNC